jgi:hypothetical protein
MRFESGYGKFRLLLGVLYIYIYIGRMKEKKKLGWNCTQQAVQACRTVPMRVGRAFHARG